MTGPVLVVTGSRYGRADVWYWLDRWVAKYGKPALVVQSVDEQARDWCFERGIVHQITRADWARLKLRAGPERNGRMVARAIEASRHRQLGAPHCLGFPAGDAKGTRDCMRQARAAGCVVHELPLMETP